MRPVNQGEVQRIKDQATTRFYGQSEFAFQIEYFAYMDGGVLDPIDGDPTSFLWWEEGFFGEFNMASKNITTNFDLVGGGQVVGQGRDSFGNASGASQVTYAAQTAIGATLSMPVEFYSGLITQGGYGTYGHHREFKFSEPSDVFLVHDTVYCRKVWIKTMNGQPMPAHLPNVYSINTTVPGTAGYEIEQEATVTIDTVTYRLVATVNEGSIISTGMQGGGPNKRGAGVVDSSGYLSDRKGYDFTYQTTGDLRRFR